MEIWNIVSRQMHKTVWNNSAATFLWNRFLHVPWSVESSPRRMDDCDYHVHSLVLMDLLTFFFWSFSREELLCDFLLASHSHRLRLAGISGSIWSHPCSSRATHSTVPRPICKWLLICKEKTSWPLWAICARASSHTQHRSASVCLDGTPCVPVCARYLLSQDWTLLQRAWLLVCLYTSCTGRDLSGPTLPSFNVIESITCGFAEGHMLAHSRK